MVDKFFGLHQAVMRSGLWAKMRPGEQSLYVALMHESERRSTREFSLKDADLSRISGLSTRTLHNARVKLQEYGLILCLSGSGNVYKYTICNPGTGLPYPGEARKRVPYVKKAKTDGEGERLVSAPPQSPSPLPQPRSRSPLPLPQPPSEKSLPLESYGLAGVFDNERSWRTR